MQKRKILVTGQHGQLGNELKVLSQKYADFDYIFTDVAELDITDEGRVADFFDRYKPSFCINAAAYTAVDKAETERELALRINAEAVGHIAKNCVRCNTRFVHISTDYVFDGNATAPYKEDDPVSPVNFYGESKLRGEEAALQHLPSSIIIRTSWVYSYYGHNFVKTMMRLMKERDSLNVVSDQFGSPTYAADLAEAIMNMISMPSVEGGIYHYSNDGIISWFDFAVAIRDCIGSSCSVNPVDTSGYPTPAKRPAYSAMNKDKIKSVGIQLHDWKESLQRCIHLLQQ